MLVRRDIVGRGNDLHTVYRPCTLDEIVGNDSIIKVIKNDIVEGCLPHTHLFSGPSGCGKTTLARIVALSLNCTSKDTEPGVACLICESCLSILNQNNMDYVEVNVGSDGGKHEVDAVINDLSSAPFQSKYKIIIFDEAHKLTPAAKDLLLKPTEDTYDHVYFIFCTNQPEKLLGSVKDGNPFLGRCRHYVLSRLDSNTIIDMLVNVAEFEGSPYDKGVLSYISELVHGEPRAALQALGTTISEGSWDKEVLKVLLGNELLEEAEEEIRNLSKLLLKKDWTASVNTFDNLAKKKYAIETIRINVAGYFVGCLKKAGVSAAGAKFSAALDSLSVPIYQTGKPAEHIFYNVMYKVVKALG